MKKQPQISEDKILEASWELLGEDGIEKLSMRRLADRLGIQAPSLYWHFKSKQQLYQRLANHVSKVIVDELHSDGNWKEQLTELAVTTRAVLNRYPCSTQLMMMTLPHDPDIIRFSNQMLACVEETPLAQDQKMQVVTTLVNFVFYFVLDQYQHMRNVEIMSQEQQSTMSEHMTQVMDSMRDEDVWLFRRMFHNQLFELMGSDRAFDFGLKVILLGIEQVILEQEMDV